MYPIRRSLIGPRCWRSDTRAQIELECGHVCLLHSDAGDIDEQIVGVMEHGYRCRLCPSVERDLTPAEVATLRKRVARGEFANTLQTLPIPDSLLADVLGHRAVARKRRVHSWLGPAIRTFCAVCLAVCIAVVLAFAVMLLWLAAGGAA